MKPIIITALALFSLSAHAGCYYKDKTGNYVDCETHEPISLDSARDKIQRSRTSSSYSAPGLRPGELQMLNDIRAEEERYRRDYERQEAMKEFNARWKEGVDDPYNQQMCNLYTRYADQYQRNKSRGHTASEGMYYDDKIEEYEAKAKEYCSKR